MPLVQVIVLAVLQGITEFLPISSSAHLALTPWLFGWPDQGLEFDIALHFGTLFSVLLYFFRDWVRILANGFGLSAMPFSRPDAALDRNPRLLWYLAAATIPAGVAGLLFKDTVESTLRSPYVMGTMLIVVGLVMWAAERLAKHERNIGQMNLLDCLFVGAAQALALIPGTSRSGITMTAGLFRNLDRATAARFSFLLSTPIVAAAAMKGLLDLRKHGALTSEALPSLAIGIVVTAITGCFVIAVLLKYLRTNSVTPFVIYRIGFGILVLGLAFARS
ncbi:MAG TPA: undecaprenyl-diphosphatase UppP [Bryobacteraceae bacterium]|nr:undecaprenyl-diphosphatase UppP [Bryobacteraceae bacterium]